MEIAYCPVLVHRHHLVIVAWFSPWSHDSCSAISQCEGSLCLLLLVCIISLLMLPI